MGPISVEYWQKGNTVPAQDAIAEKHFLNPSSSSGSCQRFGKGVGGKGWRLRMPKMQRMLIPRIMFSSSTRGNSKEGAEKRPESLAWKGFPHANPLCPPSPFETSDPGNPPQTKILTSTLQSLKSQMPLTLQWLLAYEAQ